MENSKIEWTDHTFNPWVGCMKISPGCDRCYAEGWAKRAGTPELWAGERRRTSAANWRKPLRWNDRAESMGCRERVFCASLADVFDNQVPPIWRDDLWSLIRLTPALNWQLLTKRPQNIVKMLPNDWGDGYANVWLGTTTEDQERWDQRWPHLAAVPAVVRFVSYEPAIGPISMCGTEVFPDWLICGGESGSGARMMDPDWARCIQEKCAFYGVSFFMKQMTGRAPIPTDLQCRQFPTAA